MLRRNLLRTPVNIHDTVSSPAIPYELHLLACVERKILDGSDRRQR